MTSKSKVVKIAAHPAKKAIKFVPGKATLADSFSGDDITSYEFKTLYRNNWNPMPQQEIRNAQ